MSQTSAQIEAEIRDTNEPIIIEFHGQGCTPCVTQEDILSHAAAHPNFPARLVSINVDEQPDYAKRYGVEVVPSVVLVQPGKQPRRFSGLVDAGSVISEIEKVA